ncbi:MAG: nicotinate-nucleotide adenylyltransferase [Bacteroidetes bacterium]|nr:nicotinate-nucleotide adenylyltransferase [Bacteroidota bacterium]
MKGNYKKVGLFFGSFNPIHTGHLIVANYMAGFTDLDEVWFVVSPHNPLKEKKSLLSNIHRLTLVRLATEEHPNLKVCDIEMKLPQPSYTIRTLTYLAEEYPENHFVLICGTDILPSFHKWKNYEQILEQYELYIYPRPGYDPGEWKGHPKIKYIAAPMVEISASFIRKGIQDEKNMDFFLPSKVYEYMRGMNFYEKKKKSGSL